MKKQKLLLVILAVLLLIPMLSLSVSAFGWTAKVNSDYSAITWNGYNYIRVNGQDIAYVYDAEFIDDLLLPDGEYDHVRYVNANGNEYVIELELDFNEGGYATYYYVREDKLDEYNNALQKGSGEFSIYLGWIFGFGSEDMDISRDSIYSNPITMKGHEVARYSNIIYVDQTIFDGTVELSSRGYIFKDENGKFYFLDYYQFDDHAYNHVSQADTVTVYEITDKEIIDALTDDAYTDYYSDDTGTVGYFIFSEAVYAVALGLLPCIIALASFIIGIFARKEYKKFFFIISALCILAAVFTFISVLLSVIFFLV